MASVLIVGAIIISIGLGFKTKINTGLFGIAFAYLLGCFVSNMSAKDIVNTWPISIFFTVFAVSLFYSFAIANGTLEKLALHLLYRWRGVSPALLPFAFFLAAALIAALGAGYFTVMAFLLPICLVLCDKVGMNKVVGAIAVNAGSLAGANFMTSQSGVLFRGLIDSAGCADASFRYAACIFTTSMIFSVLLISWFVFFQSRGKSVGNLADMKKPEGFNDRQKANLYLILTMLVVLLGMPVASMIFPRNAVIKMINSKMDVGLVAIVMSVVALFLKLADEKQVIARVPWNTLIMICGVGMLIAVAIKVGTVNALANWVRSNIPAFWVPVVISMIASAMSFFSSTLGVVVPTLFPIVPSLARAGLDPMLLFTCIVIGSQASALSPFSSGGSLTLGACATEEERSKIFPQLLFTALPCTVGLAVVVSFVLSLVL